MKFLRTLLTTLFVSVMPFATAYADETLETTIGATCEATEDRSISKIYPEEMRQVLAAKNGTVQVYKDKEAFRIIAEVTEMTGIAPPSAPFDALFIVFPGKLDEVFLANTATFNNGCFVQFGRLPAAAVLEAIERMKGSKS